MSEPRILLKGCHSLLQTERIELVSLFCDNFWYIREVVTFQTNFYQDKDNYRPRPKIVRVYFQSCVSVHYRSLSHDVLGISLIIQWHCRPLPITPRKWELSPPGPHPPWPQTLPPPTTVESGPYASYMKVFFLNDLIFSMSRQWVFSDTSLVLEQVPFAVEVLHQAGSPSLTCHKFRHPLI